MNKFPSMPVESFLIKVSLDFLWRGYIAFQGTFSNIWRPFWLSQLGKKSLVMSRERKRKGLEKSYQSVTASLNVIFLVCMMDIIMLFYLVTVNIKWDNVYKVLTYHSVWHIVLSQQMITVFISITVLFLVIMLHFQTKGKLLQNFERHLKMNFWQAQAKDASEK